jgi:hypothetical protein
VSLFFTDISSRPAKNDRATPISIQRQIIIAS